MARHGTAREVKLRLYMEGRLVENALVSIQASADTGQPSTAQLELVPTNTIKHIMPLTWVHVFSTDPWEASPNGDLSDYKLLFEGVVITKAFSKQDDARSFVVQCADPSIFWAYAKQFWINISSADGSIMDQMAIQTSGGYGRFGKIGSSGAFGYMTSKLTFTKEQPEERFMDTLIQVLDDIGNVNPFYTNCRNRFRITDRILRAPAGNTVKLFQLALLGDFIEGLAGRQSGQSNLVDVVNQLLSAIMHEWVSVLAPPYMKTRIFDRDVYGNIKKIKKTVRHRGPRERSKVDIFDYSTAQDNIVASLIFKPHVYTIDPPSFNTLFPNMYDQLSYSQDFRQEPSRLSMKPQLPMMGARATMGLLLQRPTELEVFHAMTKDRRRKTSKKRDPDAKYADGESQSPTYNDYDWTTNEERIRGLVYNFINLAPAPSTLTLQKQGEKQANNSRKGGVPDYLQNVCSYEYYKSKYVGRALSIAGPYNIRPVPGFPILILDDSDANMNIIGYLKGLVHSVDARGNAITQYIVLYPRIVNDVDYNQPRFKGGYTSEGDLDLDLVRDENGNYHFELAFDGENQPPVPEWFDESFRNTRDLDWQYRAWFGNDAGVVQHILFRDPSTGLSKDVINAAIEEYGIEVEGESWLTRVGATVARVVNELGAASTRFEEILETNENISVNEAVDELNRRYAAARSKGKEFEEASSFTKRNFTQIDEAFRFIGAAPREVSDRVVGARSGDYIPVTFNNNPAGTRKVDYKRMRLDYFVGDTSPGSGYAGTAEGDTFDIYAEDDETVEETALTDIASNRMSGAFPVFDTEIHEGDQATDKKTRNALVNDPDQQARSSWARYDGRPHMFDFEYRLWQQSLADAGFSPTEEEIEENAEVSDYKVSDDRGNIVVAKTAEEKAAVVERRKEIVEARDARYKRRDKRGRNVPKQKKTMNNKTQAPTGDGFDQEEKNGLPQPLSEKQVVDLRRQVVEAYRDELAKKRGFVG